MMMAGRALRLYDWRLPLLCRSGLLAHGLSVSLHNRSLTDTVARQTHAVHCCVVHGKGFLHPSPGLTW